MKGIIPCVAGALALTITIAGAQSPYSGQESRIVKALSGADVRAYLNGEGMGYAKAGELNHYPGPRHVLDLADKVGLSADQRRRIEKIYSSMHYRAVPLGRQIVDGEAKLDAQFASGRVTPDRLAAATAAIAVLQGKLRAVHLSAHLATKVVLSATQIAAYDGLRGYGKTDARDHHQHTH